jgi:F0F1-type ATP synthase membrane subunit c/vacuolar-type H+-ATPase subunit K
METSSALKLLGAGVALIGSLGAGIGLGMIFSAWLSALARNPSAEAKYRAVGFIGAAFAEFVFLGGLVIAFLLIFVAQ